MKIYYIPIEKLEERYSEQWYRWFPIKFRKAGYEVKVIDGEALTDKVETGHFLDVNSTLHYKATQLKKIGKLFYQKKVKPGDIFFVADIEFWGIESIRYLSVLNRIPIKLYAFLHAASYTPEDFMQPCESFAQIFEKGWIRVCDKVFVASEYHKKLVCQARNLMFRDQDKIIVTGNPWDTKEAWDMVGKVKKQDRIIYTDLPDYRKRPNIFLNFVPILKKLMPDTEILFTTSREKWGETIPWLRQSMLALYESGLVSLAEGLKKKDYYTLLAGSMVMVSTNLVTEAFGYCACEALTFNTNPILPNKFSYPELVQNDSRLLYNSLDELVDKIQARFEAPISTQKYAEKFDESIERMIEQL